LKGIGKGYKRLGWRIMEFKRYVFGGRKLNKRQQKLWHMLGFLVRLLVLAIPLYLVIGLLSIGANAPMQAMQVTVASQSAWLLESMGFQITQDGSFIEATGPGAMQPFHFFINEDCTGWKSMLFLFALMFAVPGVALRRRLWGLVFGLPAIWLVNLVRVVGVVLSERVYGVQTAMVIHDYGWQFGLIVLVLGLWLLWLRWVRSEEKKRTPWARMKSKVKKIIGGIKW